MRRLLLNFFILSSLVPLAYCASEAMPLTILFREAMEGMVWDMGVVNLNNGQSYNGYLQGIGSPGPAGIGYDIKGEWEMLEATIGYSKNSPARRSCRFTVVADQEPIYTSSEFKGDQAPEQIKVPLEGKRIIMLRIEPISYGGTLGACFASPMLKRGLSEADKASPYQVEINGQKVPYSQVNAPDSLPVSLPIKPGDTSYTVKIHHDNQQRKIQIITSP